MNRSLFDLQARIEKKYLIGRQRSCICPRGSHKDKICRCIRGDKKSKQRSAIDLKYRVHCNYNLVIYDAFEKLKSCFARKRSIVLVATFEDGWILSIVIRSTTRKISELEYLFRYRKKE